MKSLKYLIVTFLTVVSLAAFVPPAWAAAEEPVATLISFRAPAEAGRVVVDVAKHGEAWYVSPVTFERTYLGRPQEALGRLVELGQRVPVSNIESLPTSVGTTWTAAQSAYVDSVLGQVLVPSDAIGAAWYVDPTLKIRRRLATPSEAWEIMRYGTPISAKALKAIAVRKVAPVSERVTCKEVTAGDKLKLADGRCVRLINVSVPANPELQSAAMDRLKNFCGAAMTIERDDATADADGCVPRHVFAGETYLNHDLVRRGLAFHDITSPNFKYAEALVVGSLDAARQKQGFWNK
jgi:endonuclease YncB( thermonuclease family)